MTWSPLTLLSHLTPADTGDKSPNPSSSWQLSQLGITDSLSKLLPGKLFYHWVQRLAGLDFLETKQHKESETAVVEARPEVSQLYMETTINNIRSRLETRISLHKQVESLTNHKIDSASVSGESKLPTRAVSRLKSWQSVDWETYSQHEFSQHLVTSELVHQHCHLYKCTVTRDKAIMTALVSISPSHPTVTPLWCLSLKIGDNNETQETSEVIRDMEQELNTRNTSLSLPSMVHKLLLLTDIVLEVSSSMESDGDKFMKSQPFLDNVRGRMRRLPLHYNSAQQMFQQR